MKRNWYAAIILLALCVLLFRAGQSVDRTTARKKLDTCLANLEELRRTVEALKAGLDG